MPVNYTPFWCIYLHFENIQTLISRCNLKRRERKSEKLTHQNCYHQSLGHRHLFVKEEYGWCLSKSLKILEKTNFFHPSDLQLGLRALQCSEEGMILQTNIYENDKLLLDCFKNFYNSEKRAIAIYRLLKVKMGSCNTGLYSTFPPVIFYCTSLFRRPLYLLHSVCGWWYSICLHSWVLEALTSKKSHETSLLFSKVLLEFLMQSDSLKQKQAFYYNRGYSFPGEGEGSRLICLTEDASHSLSVEQTPSVTSVWVEKHKRFWIQARELCFHWEKPYHSLFLFHLP